MKCGFSKSHAGSLPHPWLPLGELRTLPLQEAAFELESAPCLQQKKGCNYYGCGVRPPQSSKILWIWHEVPLLSWLVSPLVQIWWTDFALRWIQRSPLKEIQILVPPDVYCIKKDLLTVLHHMKCPQPSQFWSDISWEFLSLKAGFHRFHHRSSFSEWQRILVEDRWHHRMHYDGRRQTLCPAQTEPTLITKPDQPPKSSCSQNSSSQSRWIFHDFPQENAHFDLLIPAIFMAFHGHGHD